MSISIVYIDYSFLVEDHETWRKSLDVTTIISLTSI